MRIVCLSDTHNFHRNIDVPNGDVLIHSGDATINGTIPEVTEFAGWFSSHPHKWKVFVAGNHDWLFERDRALAANILGQNGIIYLFDRGITIEGLKFYGSPWQPWFFDWAFNLKRGAEIKQKWDLIPRATDVLITHGPPFGIQDTVPHGANVGCGDLFNAISEMPNLRLHVFGHIHHSYGKTKVNQTTFVNAAICDEAYRTSNIPIVVDLSAAGRA